MLTLPTTYTMCDHASITKYNIFFSCECDTFGLYSHSGRVWAHDLSWQIRVIVTVWQTLYRNIISLFLYLHLWWFVLSIARAITPFLQFFKESMSLRWWWQHKKMHLSLSMTRRPFLNFALWFFSLQSDFTVLFFLSFGSWHPVIQPFRKKKSLGHPPKNFLFSLFSFSSCLSLKTHTHSPTHTQLFTVTKQNPFIFYNSTICNNVSFLV